MLDEKTKDLILNLAINGEPLQRILSAIEMRHRDFHNALQQDVLFLSEYERARSEGLEVLADSLILIPEDVQDVQKAKLKSDNIKFLLSKRKPMTYGDRIDVNLTQTVDIGSALDAARSRILIPGRDSTVNAIPQAIDITRLATSRITDSESVTPPEVAPVLKTDDIFD